MTNDKIIYGETFLAAVFSMKLPFKGQAFTSIFGPFKGFLQNLLPIIRFGGCKKSYSAKINTKDDSSCAGKITCNFQNRSISSEDKNDARVLKKIFVVLTGTSKKTIQGMFF